MRPLASVCLLLALTAASACQRATGGPLEPVASGNVAVADGHATVRTGAVSAAVAGRWSSTGENALRVTYRNGGNVPLRIRIDAIGMTHSSGDAALRTAVDATGVDLADGRTDNDRPRVLFALENGGGPAMLDLAPGASRDIDAELTSFSNDKAVGAGDRITATVPMAAGVATVSFVARKP